MQVVTGRQQAEPCRMLFRAPEMLRHQRLHVVHLHASQLPFYAFLPKIQGWRCPAGHFEMPPACSGSVCLPCLWGQIRNFHPEAVYQTAPKMVQLWNDALAPRVAGPPYLLDNLLYGAEPPTDSERRVPEGLIRDFRAQTTDILMQVEAPPRHFLAGYGRVRTHVLEVCRMVQVNGLLQETDLEGPFCLAEHLVGHAGGTFSQGLAMLRDVSEEICVAWLHHVAGDVLTRQQTQTSSCRRSRHVS